MTAELTPRLRMFAGPNGSGKSIIKSDVGKIIGKEHFGHYVNPDEIEKTIKQSGFLDFSDFNLEIEGGEALDFFRKSRWLVEKGLETEAYKIRFDKNKLNFTEVEVNSYFASVASDFIRRKLLFSKQTFTFETVMSSRDKVDFLAEAQSAGYRTYLYYVATEDPLINVSRVEFRVKEGGHNVPTDKIISRYKGSLKLLLEAIKNSNRAYIFDNSIDKFDEPVNREGIAEITEGATIELKTDDVPAWFKKYVIDKIIVE
jgi:predicted ABC-type ATPase